MMPFNTSKLLITRPSSPSGQGEDAGDAGPQTSADVTSFKQP